MGTLQRHHERLPEAPQALEPAAPLWRHAPARDAAGKPLCDCMLLVPALRAGGLPRVLASAQLHAVLTEFGDRVVFADLNLRLGLLWVTVQSQAGLSAEVAGAIQQRLPGARLVGSYLQRPRRRGWRLLARVRALLGGPGPVTDPT